jgi:hypothetical protein
MDSSQLFGIEFSLKENCSDHKISIQIISVRFFSTELNRKFSFTSFRSRCISSNWWVQITSERLLCDLYSLLRHAFKMFDKLPKSKILFFFPNNGFVITRAINIKHVLCDNQFYLCCYIYIC